MEIRSFTMEDADFLLELRNYTETIESSTYQKKISVKEHLVWMKATLSHKSDRVFVFEEKGIRVGVVRTCYDCDIGHTLSWVVVRGFRGRGVGKKIVTMAILKLKGDINAIVKDTNKESIRIAEFIGMEHYKNIGGFRYYNKKLGGGEK